MGTALMFDEIRQLVDSARKSFNDKEKYLIKANLSERCICAKFASHLEKVLSNSIYKDYNVDVEYNRGIRDDHYVKKAIGGVGRATVDLIVHKRETDDNLICIEMKKSSKPRHLVKDKQRLEIMTGSSFNYVMGFMIVVEKWEPSTCPSCSDTRRC